MATTKTLTPTNQAITLAAFTEKPDNRTNVTNDDKLADAVNTLNSKLEDLKIQRGQVTGISIPAKSQVEVTVSLPQNYAGGTSYIAIANVYFYGPADAFTAVLIRSQQANQFVCRIKSTYSDTLNDVALNWITVKLA